MKERVHEFFEALSEEWDRPARILLIGAAAGALWGSLRASRDVDFEIRLSRAGSGEERVFEAALQRAIERTGIQANYGAEIGRWGMISMVDYRRHASLYRRFGKLEVCLLDPVYWAIGKIDRYTHSDVQDLAFVLRKRRSSWDAAARVWGRSVRESPLSEARLLFRKHVEHFLRVYGRKIWGWRFEPDAAIAVFRKHAGISRLKVE